MKHLSFKYFDLIFISGCKKPDIPIPNNETINSPTDTRITEGNCMFPVLIESNNFASYLEFSINKSETKMVCRKQSFTVEGCTTLVSNHLVQISLSDFSEKTILE